MSPFDTDNGLRIGHILLVQPNRVTAGCVVRSQAKIDSRNPAYSVKWRIGAAMVAQAEQDGFLAVGNELIEVNNVNTRHSPGANFSRLIGPAHLVLIDGQLSMRGAIASAQAMANSEPDRYVLLQYYSNPARSIRRSTTTQPGQTSARLPSDSSHWRRLNRGQL